jgi:hypothetical protein
VSEKIRIYSKPANILTLYCHFLCTISILKTNGIFVAIYFDEFRRNVCIYTHSLTSNISSFQNTTLNLEICSTRVKMFIYILQLQTRKALTNYLLTFTYVICLCKNAQNILYNMVNNFRPLLVSSNWQLKMASPGLI